MAVARPTIVSRPKPADASTDGPSPLMQRADRFLLIGIVLGGTWVLGVFAIPFLIMAFLLMKEAQARGELHRPWSVTIIGTFCMIDAMVNALAWGMDLTWAHDTGVLQTLWSGYGKLVDGAYYIDYNGHMLGGTSDYSEKTLEIWGILLMYPMRVGAAWGFLRMRRWGLQAMIITSWLYVAFWIGYVAALYLNFDTRVGASEGGVVGWWIVVILFASPFVMLPYLYTVNRELFVDEP